jgi:hypothetical protein
MRLTPLTQQGCGTGACPDIYASDRHTIVFQGPLVTPPAAEAAAGPGEGFVELPWYLVAEVLPKLQLLFAGMERPA